MLNMVSDWVRDRWPHSGSGPGQLPELPRPSGKLGEIVHKGQSYAGDHAAIISKPLWDEVQHRLAVNRHNRVTDATVPSLLAGLLYDDTGDRVVPTHSSTKGRRYRYYVSGRLTGNSKNRASHGRRVPTGDLEGLVETRLQRFLTNQAELLEAVGDQSTSYDIGQMLQQAKDLA